MYEDLADLPFEVTDCTLSRRERDTTSGFVRTTTVVELHGLDGPDAADRVGRGEDVTYETADHDRLQANADALTRHLTGSWTLDALSGRLADLDLFFGDDPDQPAFRSYRRWAIESAALDLALRRAGTDLGTALDRSYDPVRFVVSTRLGDPPTADRVLDLLDRRDLEFKLDPTDGWTPDLIDRLAATGAVRTVDLKGQYRGTVVDQAPNPDLYERVLSGLPDAVVEDPAVTDETRPLLADEVDRLAWDAPVTGVDAVRELPWEPTWINVKPSRFGSVRSLLATVDYCRSQDIRMYGGGQFELGVGRRQVQALASLLYPDAPNDVAPGGYNDPNYDGDLPDSPLPPPEDPRGFDF